MGGNQPIELATRLGSPFNKNLNVSTSDDIVVVLILGKLEDVKNETNDVPQRENVDVVGVVA